MTEQKYGHPVISKDVNGLPPCGEGDFYTDQVSTMGPVVNREDMTQDLVNAIVTTCSDDYPAVNSQTIQKCQSRIWLDFGTDTLYRTLEVEFADGGTNWNVTLTVD